MTLHTAVAGDRYHALLPAALAVFAGSLLLTISAKIAIPFFPVPLTMQTFVVIGLGLALGSRLGALTVTLYLAQGAAGLPVFTGTPEKGLGLAYMAGPTGGYLIGFVAAAFVAGLLAERGFDRRIATSFLAALVATAVIYIPGLLWLGALVGWDKPVIAWGLTPFLYGDLLKAGLAALVFPAMWTFLKNRGIA